MKKIKSGSAGFYDYYNLANKYYNNKNDQALDYAKKAYRLMVENKDNCNDEQKKELIDMMGDIYYKMEKFDKSLKFYEKSIAIEPDNEMNRWTYASCLTKTGRNKDAIKEYDELIKNEKESSSIFYYYEERSRCHFELKNYKAAIKDISFVIDNSVEEDEDFFYHRGLCYFNLGEKREALKDFNKSYNIYEDEEVKVWISKCGK